MTFKKPEMDKTLRNGLRMSEMDPLNHKWLDFTIQLGLALHQFKKKLLLSKNSVVSKLFYFCPNGQDGRFHVPKYGL